MNLLDYSLPELYGLFLRYCDTLQVINLRKTCKTLRQRIPASWEIYDLIIQHEQSIDFLGSTYYRFLNRLNIMFHSIQYLHLDASKFRFMNDLTLVKLDQLEMIKLDPKLINFERIFINYAKSLTQLEIPKEYTLLDMIYLSYLNLSFFIIHPTWERLQVIALIGMTSLTQIVIPKDCTRINYINISKSGVKKIIIHPILQNDLHIQASGVFHTLTIHTHKKNIKYIQPSITFVFKPI